MVPEEVNRLSVEYCDQDEYYEPTGILAQDWFHEGVVCNPAAAGPVRSLLGPEFYLPVLMSNHRVEAPFDVGGWHVDGNSAFGPELN